MLPNTDQKRVISGSDIKNLRTSLGFSQAEFGKELAFTIGRSAPYTRGAISAIEKGHHSVSEEIIRGAKNLYRQLMNDKLIVFHEGIIQHLPGQVPAGAIYGGTAGICKWEDCKSAFIPTAPNQKQCQKCIQRGRR